MQNSVLYVNPTAIHGGAEEALLGTMHAAKNMGYKPILVVPQKGWLTQQCEQRNISYEILSTLPETIKTEHWAAQVRSLPANVAALSKLIKRNRATLVHSNTPRASYHAGIAARLTGVPAVTHCHDIVGSPFLSKKKARFLASLCDRLIVVSEAVRQSILNQAEYLRNKTVVIYNGLDRYCYDRVLGADLDKEFGIPKEATVFGTAGAIRSWKGQDLLIEAFQETNKMFPKAFLLIVGGAQGSKEQSEFEHKLREQVSRLNLKNKVVFTGWRDDVWELMKSMTVFVHVPTQPDPLPTAVIHACGLGCAIVGARIGGIPEILDQGNAGQLVIPNDPIRLSNMLNKLITDTTQLAHLRAEARKQFLKTFTLEQMQSRLESAYQMVLKQ